MISGFPTMDSVQVDVLPKLRRCMLWPSSRRSDYLIVPLSSYSLLFIGLTFSFFYSCSFFHISRRSIDSNPPPESDRPCKLLHENLTVAQLVKKYPAFFIELKGYLGPIFHRLSLNTVILRPPDPH
jgi:hypothetical protein